jgi:hypothetical protein
MMPDMQACDPDLGEIGAALPALLLALLLALL